MSKYTLAFLIFISGVSAFADDKMIGMFPIVLINSTGDAQSDYRIAKTYCIDYVVKRTWLGAECQFDPEAITPEFTVKSGKIRLSSCMVHGVECPEAGRR